MKILVTGGFGFVGSHLVERLFKEGHEITIIDNLSTGNIKNLIGIPLNEINFIKENIEDIDFDIHGLYEFDEVYHLAASVGVKNVLAFPLQCINSNIDGTKNLLDTFVRFKSEDIAYKYPKIFIASTSEVYGKNDKWRLTEEDDRITGSTQKKRWVYAETKAMDEFLANIYAEQYGMKIIIARFFSIVGPRQCSRYGMVLPAFVEQAISGADITIYGDGTQIRSFMHVNDCLDCVLSLMREYKLGDDHSQVFNVGNPDPVMIRDLAWRVRHFSESKSRLVYIPYVKAYEYGFEDMRRRVPSIDKLESYINVIAQNFKDLDEIIEDTIKYFREGDR